MDGHTTLLSIALGVLVVIAGVLIDALDTVAGPIIAGSGVGLVLWSAYETRGDEPDYGAAAAYGVVSGGAVGAFLCSLTA